MINHEIYMLYLRTVGFSVRFVIHHYIRLVVLSTHEDGEVGAGWIIISFYGKMVSGFIWLLEFQLTTRPGF